MVIMISSTVLNIILDPLLIFGIGPFPELSVAGAALGTAISQTLGALLGLYYLLTHKTAFRIKFAHLRPDMSILKDIYRVGAPSAITQLLESMMFMVFNKVVSSFGSLFIAVVGLTMRISDLAFMPILGVSNGLLPIVGYNFGARKHKRLWQSVKLASLGLMVFLAVASVLIIIFAPQRIDIFSDDPALIEAAVPAMRIMLSTLVCIGPTILFVTAFQGLSQGMKSLFLSLLRQLIFFIPLLFLFRHLFGLWGVWVSMPASDILSVALTFAFIWQEYRQHPVEDDGDIAPVI
jgi:putative MATE family efflux protein